MSLPRRLAKSVRQRRMLTVAIVLTAMLATLYVLQLIQRQRAWLTVVEQTRAVFEPAMAAYLRGPDDEVARTLRAYLAFLETSTSSSVPWQVPPFIPWQSPADPSLDRQRLELERTVTTARLAIVEERLGDQEAAANTWARASQHAARADVPYTDPDSLREIVCRLDMGHRPESP